MSDIFLSWGWKYFLYCCIFLFREQLI